MRLATYNLLNGRSLDDGLVDLARLHEAVRMLDADVLGVQEVDRDQPRSGGHDLTEEVAKALGAEHWRFEPAIVGTPGFGWRAATDADSARSGEPGYGVGLVSRLPVLEWRVVRLHRLPVRAPVLVSSRRLILADDEPRVGLAAVVETPVGPVTVITTHLSFIPVWCGIQLRTLVAGMADLPVPQILMGDLNMPQRIAGLVSRWRPLAPNVKTFPSPSPRMQLDHVLARGGLPPVIRVDAPHLPVSDHRPLVVDFAVQG